MPSTAEQLMKLAEMKEKGLLDMAEFQDQKAKIMAGNGVVADGIAVAMPSNGDREARERQERIEREEKRERQERQERQDRQDRQDRQVKSRTTPSLLSFRHLTCVCECGRIGRTRSLLPSVRVIR